MAVDIEVIDPFDNVENPPEFAFELVGEISMDVYLFQFVNKQKVAFDESNKNKSGRTLRAYTAIDMEIFPLDADRYPWKRPFIAEFDEWKMFTLPSLKALGANVRELNGKWAKVKLVKTGRKYFNRENEEREATTFEFLAIYDNLADAEQAQAELDAERDDNGTVPSTPETIKAVAPDHSTQYDTALQFMEAFAKQAVEKTGGDLVKAKEYLAKEFASQPLLSDYFTVESPEVLEAITKATSS